MSSSYMKIKLGDIGVFKSGGTPSRNRAEYFEGNLPWITTTSLGKKFIDEKDTATFITEDALINSATKLIQENSIMIGIRVGVGKVSINAVPMCTSQDIVSIEEIDGARFFKPYIVYYIKSIKPYLETQKRGATIQGITTDVLKKLDIAIPEFEAQKKIADTLDIVSELLTLYRRQLEKFDLMVKSRFIARSLIRLEVVA